MNLLKTIKDKLLYGLQDSLMNLIDEDLTTVLELKNKGIKYAIDKIMESKSFKDVNLLSYAIMLKSESGEVQSKIKAKNFEIFNDCFSITNGITFQKVIQKYFENPNDNHLKVINSINDVDYHTYVLNNEEKGILNFKVLDIIPKMYKNPYTNTAVSLKSDKPQSMINLSRDNQNRSITSVVNIHTHDQTALLNYKDKSYSGLTNHFSFNQIVKFEVEFTLFHELAHAAVTIRNKYGREDESVSDICGTIKVIKNNDMSVEEAVDYVNHRINFRCRDNALRFHSQEFTATDIENEADVRIHATQLSLLTLKQFVETDFEFLLTLDTNEELILASDLSRTANARHTLNEVKNRHFDNKTSYEEISLDSWTKNEKFIECCENIAKERNSTVDEVFKNLKTNLYGNTDKVFDVMTAYYAMAEPEELKNLESYSMYIGEITKNFLFHEKNAAIDVDLAPNFSDKELKSLIDKQKKSRSKLFDQ
jgi:hypothetical protein